MTEQRKQQQLAKLAVTTLAIIGFFIAGQMGVAAQEKPYFKVGDRVAVLYPGSQDVRYKGKVTAVERGGECYAIAIDGESTSATTFCTKYVPIVRLGKDDAPVFGNDKAAEPPRPPARKEPVREGNAEQTGTQDAEGFQPGDRVEVRVGNEWRKATIVANEVSENKSYVVRRDDDPLIERRMALSTVRALKDPASDDGGKKIAADAQRSVEFARSRCAGEPLINLRTKGRTASATLFSQVLRADNDRAASNSNHQQVTTIDSISVGASFRRGAITVYPVNVSLTTCEDAMAGWRLSVAKNYDYVCYVDPARGGEWTCGIYKSGINESIIVPKPEANKMTTGKPKKP